MTTHSEKTTRATARKKVLVKEWRNPTKREKTEYKLFKLNGRTARNDELSVFWYFTHIGTQDERMVIADKLDELCYYHITSGVMLNAAEIEQMMMYGTDMSTGVNWPHHGFVTFKEKRTVQQVREIFGRGLVHLQVVTNIDRTVEYIKDGRHSHEEFGRYPHFAYSFSCPVHQRVVPNEQAPTRDSINQPSRTVTA